MPSSYWVYILASHSRRLYVGVTRDVARRLEQHRSDGDDSGFARRYRVTRLVHYELYTDIRTAIAREKQLKGWMRRRKLDLIEEANPDWRDLSDEWKHPAASS